MFFWEDQITILLLIFVIYLFWGRWGIWGIWAIWAAEKNLIIFSFVLSPSVSTYKKHSMDGDDNSTSDFFFCS